MPRNARTPERMEDLPVEERLLLEPDHSQIHWYAHAAAWGAGKAVLDVGAGSGYGLAYLRAAGPTVLRGIDLAPAGPLVELEGIGPLPDRSYDLVVCIDVIEHVEDDREFLADLLRVARERVFFTTPNWNRSRCANRLHVREYTPDELADLLRWYRYTAWTGVEKVVQLPDEPQGETAARVMVHHAPRVRDVGTAHSFGILIEAAEWRS